MDDLCPPGRIPLHLWQVEDFRQWYMSCPPEVRHLAACYPYGTRYLAKKGGEDWYMPHRYLEDGGLLMIRYAADTGQAHEHVAKLRPEELIPCTEH